MGAVAMRKIFSIVVLMVLVSGCADYDVEGSSEWFEYDAQQCVDGRESTLWITETATEESIIIEPDTRHAYNKLILTCNEPDGILRHFKIFGSYDSVNWKILAEDGRSKATGTTEHVFDNRQNWKYYKILMLQSSGKQFKINEIELVKR